MTLPTLTVEIGHLTGWTLGITGKSELGTTTTLASMTFDNITSKVRSLSIRRGRNHELDRVEAGTASVRLLNQDGAFNPTNTSSVYYPNIRPMIPLRIRATFLFDPTTISSLRGWWDFGDAATLFQDTALTTPVTADGQTIKGMTDKSGQGNHVTEATNGPTYKTAIQNGRSVGRYDGTNDTLRKTSAATVPAGNAPLTIFAVAKEVGPGGGTLMKQNTWTYGYPAAGPSTTIRFTTDGIQSYDQASGWTGAFDLITIILDSSVDITFWRGGGTALGTVAGTTFTASTTGTVDIGSDNTPGAFWQGDIAELAIFNVDLKATDLPAFNNVGSLFAEKWGKTWTTVT